MFSLEFQLPLPDLTAGSVWSNDGEILAVTPRVHPTVELVQMNIPERREWTTPFALRSFSAAISPNNDLLAVHQPIDGYNGLWLYSIADRKEIARVSLPVDHCTLSAGLSGNGSGLLFSSDGSELWVACNVGRLVTGNYTAAIKLGVPSMKVQGRVPRAAVAEGTLSSLRGHVLSRFQGMAILTETASILTPAPGPRRISRQFVQAMDLDSRRELFPRLEIRAETGVQSPTRIQYAIIFPRWDIAVVFRKLVKQLPAPPPEALGFALETYDTQNGSLIASFWSAKEQEADTGGRIVQIAPIADYPYVVGAIDASFNPKKHGGLIIWNALTGGVTQRIEGPSAQYVSVSPDGNRIALFAGSTLLAYRRNK